MSVILAIDPGTVQSAWLVYNPATGGVRNLAITPNEVLVGMLRGHLSPDIGVGVIEKVESYGMAVGAEVFETVHWAGRFEEALWPLRVERLPRREVKLHLCGSARAKDTNIRQALLDRLGGKAAIGTKRAPGPLYGMHGDLWAALAVAVTWADLHGEKR